MTSNVCATPSPGQSFAHTFEVGKRYNAANNALMRVTQVTADSLYATVVLPGTGDKGIQYVAYHLNGTTRGRGWDEWQLLPGAIEDDPALAFQRQHEAREHERAVDPICVLQGQIDALRRALETTNMVVGTIDRDLSDRLDRFAIEIGGKVNARTEPKPTIKGGWVNVYLTKHGYPDPMRTYSTAWVTREAALAERRTDAVACIKLPDITEGEGL